MSRLLEHIRTQAASRPDALAIVDGARKLSYAQLEEQTRALAVFLHARGVKEGDCIACIKSSMFTVVQTALAALRLGVAILPIDHRDDRNKAESIIRTARAKFRILEGPHGAAKAGADLETVCLSDIALSDVEPRLLPVPNPDSIWSVEPTSGSSGAPKLVPLSSAVLDHYIEAHATAAGLSHDDRVALFGEMWFDTVFSNFRAGTTAYCYDLRGRGTADIDRWLRQNSITGFQSYPVAFRAIVEAAKEPIPSLRFARLAGEAILPSDVEEFERVFPDGSVLTNSYGATECGLYASYDFPKGAARLEGPLPAGFPPHPGELSIVDEAGTPVPSCVTGVIVKRSRFLAEHYLNNPEKTEGVYWTEDDGTRVLYTGDLGYFDTQGCLHLIGRVDDQVKIRGYSVRYSEVEAELSKDRHFGEIAVTSWLNASEARQLVCHYTLASQETLDVKSYRASLLERLPAYMVPTYFIAHLELPKTESGKIKRKALPAPDVGCEQKALDLSQLTELQREVASVWSSVLGHSFFKLEDDFFDIGGDSLQAMSVLVAIEHKFRVRLGYESFVVSGASIADIAERISNTEATAMVALKSGTATPPVFILPVENGEFSDWLYMMNALGPTRDYSGVHVRDISKRNCFERLTVEQLARYACDAIEAAHGLGPLVLAGFSAGTSLALEVARVMQGRGATDVGLILIDPIAPPFEPERYDWWLRRIFSPILKKRDLALGFERAGHILRGKPTTELPLADEVAFRAYKPKALELEKVLIFSAEEENPSKSANEAFWQAIFSGKAEILSARGNHVHIIRDPNAEAVAARLESWIAENFS